MLVLPYSRLGQIQFFLVKVDRFIQMFVKKGRKTKQNY